jgi:hypothetical protein
VLESPPITSKHVAERALWGSELATSSVAVTVAKGKGKGKGKGKNTEQVKCGCIDGISKLRREASLPCIIDVKKYSLQQRWVYVKDSKAKLQAETD